MNGSKKPVLGSPGNGSGIQTLPAVLDPIELGKHVEFFSSPPWNWGELRDIQVQALKTGHRNRWVVEILLRTTSALHPLIGKIYAQDRSDVYQAMEAIARAGFGPRAEFSIPQPLAFLPALNLLLLEKVQGVRAKEIFTGGNERDRAEAAERCALWLAQFHKVAPLSGPILDLNRHFLSLEQWLRRIAELGELLSDKAGRLLERLKARASMLGPVKMCAGHGSYKPAQVILANGRTVTCDWDSYDVADPCRDLARFIVFLERLSLRAAGSIRVPNTAAEVFLKTYIAVGPPGVESRLPFYKAGTCVQFAKYDLSKPIPGWRAEMVAMLDEGLRILEVWI